MKRSRLVQQRGLPLGSKRLDRHFVQPKVSTEAAARRGVERDGTAVREVSEGERAREACKEAARRF